MGRLTRLAGGEVVRGGGAVFGGGGGLLVAGGGLAVRGGRRVVRDGRSSNRCLSLSSRRRRGGRWKEVVAFAL